MRRSFLSALALLASTLNANADIRTGQLDNGLQYYIERYGSDEALECRLAVRAGITDESEEQRGAARFIAHTHRRKFLAQHPVRTSEFTNVLRNRWSYQRDNFFRSQIDRFGADATLDCSLYHIAYDDNGPTEVANAIQSLASFARSLPPIHYECEWAEHCAALEDDWFYDLEDEDSLALHSFLSGSRIGPHLETPTKEDMPSWEQLQAFFRDFYRPDRMTVLLVGDLDVELTEELVRSCFGVLKNPVEAPAPKAEALEIANTAHVSISRADNDRFSIQGCTSLGELTGFGTHDQTSLSDRYMPAYLCFIQLQQRLERKLPIQEQEDDEWCGLEFSFYLSDYSDQLFSLFEYPLDTDSIQTSQDIESLVTGCMDAMHECPAFNEEALQLSKASMGTILQAFADMMAALDAEYSEEDEEVGCSTYCEDLLEDILDGLSLSNIGASVDQRVAVAMDRLPTVTLAEAQEALDQLVQGHWAISIQVPSDFLSDEEIAELEARLNN